MPEQIVSNPGSAYQTVTDFTTGFDADGLVPLAFAGSIRAEYESLLTATTDQIDPGNVVNFTAIAAAAGLRVANTTAAISLTTAGICSKASGRYTVASGNQIVRVEIVIFGPAFAKFAAAITPTFGTMYGASAVTAKTLGTAGTTGQNIALGLAPNTAATTGGLAWVFVDKT